MIRHWLYSPTLHFIVLGGLLFVFGRAWRVLDGSDQHRFTRQPIVITAEQIRVLQSDFVERWGVTPTHGQMQALIEQALSDELLYREARFLALDFQDSSVRRRLIEKVRAVSDHPARSHEELYREALALGLDNDVIIRRLLIQKMRIFLERGPHQAPLQENDLLDYLKRHRQRFLQPARVTFSHVFLREILREDGLEKKAMVVLAKLSSQSPASPAAIELSDPFPLGRQFRSYSKNQLTARFGEQFAEQVFGLEPGIWSGPFASPYGLHLVWVHEELPEAMPPLHTVRQKIISALMKERAAKQFERGLARLRKLYEVRIEGTDAT